MVWCLSATCTKSSSVACRRLLFEGFHDYDRQIIVCAKDSRHVSSSVKRGSPNKQSSVCKGVWNFVSSHQTPASVSRKSPARTVPYSPKKVNDPEGAIVPLGCLETRPPNRNMRLLLRQNDARGFYFRQCTETSHLLLRTLRRRQWSEAVNGSGNHDHRTPPYLMPHRV